MKKNYKTGLIIALTILLMSFRGVFAQNASKSATIIEVDKLKEKIASKVAEIEPTKKIVIKGKVTAVDAKNKSFTFSSKEKSYTVTFPIKTQFFWIKSNNEKLSLNFSNIEIDDELVVIGDETAGENKIIATILIGKNFLKNVVGRITSIDIKTHLIKIKTLASETEYTIDIAGVEDKMLAIKNNKELAITVNQLNKNNIILSKGILKDITKNILTANSFYLIQN
jgi:hypothetical protein